jgi:uncharacterized protein YbjT (DUF2867 family)
MDRKIILVTGATGNQGGSVAKALLDNWKFAVRVLTRYPQSPKARMLEQMGAEIVAGDFNDPYSLRNAMHGVYGVFGVTSFWEHFESEYDLGKNLIDAVKDSAIEHFVFSSQPSYYKLSGGTISVPNKDIKAELQEYAKSLQIPATFVQPAAYYENFLNLFPVHEDRDSNLYFSFPQGDTKLAMMSPTDLGVVVATIFDHPSEYTGRTVGVVGDDKTPGEYAYIFSKVFGRKVYYKNISVERYATSGLPEATELADMFEVQRLYIRERQLSLIESYGLNPGMKSFEQWLKKNKEKFGEIANARRDYAIY